VEDDSLLDAEQIEETGFIDEDGQLKRPWCPATRILEHREAEAAAREAEDRKRAAQASGAGLLGEGPAEPPPRLRLPEIVEGQPIYQKNEGGWWMGQCGAAGPAAWVDAAAGGPANIWQRQIFGGAKIWKCQNLTASKICHAQIAMHPQRCPAWPGALTTFCRLPPACRKVGVHSGGGP
jgi:hypothetical protein